MKLMKTIIAHNSMHHVHTIREHYQNVQFCYILLLCTNLFQRVFQHYRVFLGILEYSSIAENQTMPCSEKIPLQLVAGMHRPPIGSKLNLIADIKQIIREIK